MFIFGVVMRGVDNYAHLGGFAGGFVVALFLDPLKPERIKHLFWAVICLALSMLAILASVVDGLLFR
jgi:membrane associated rhomboid family serine protease